MSVKTNNPIVGERLLYFLVWAMALLVPILNSKMMSEEHVSLSNILLVWSKLLPYIIIFVINNSLLAPRYLFQRRYAAYFTFALVMLVAIFFPLEYYQDELRMIEYPDGSTYFVHGRASFTDLAWYWNVLLGIFLAIANCGIKFMFKSIQDEHRMAEMERQNLQSEMDALKYQINPHFFMNTLNNIHALIDIDAEAAVIILQDFIEGFRASESNIAETTVQNIVSFFETNQCPNELCYRGGVAEDCKSGKCF